MQLYERKVSEKGKVSYIPYVPPSTRAEITMTNGELINVTATLGTCILMGLERHMPDHSALKRRIKGVEAAILDLAKLGGTKLDQRTKDAGLHAWNAAVQKLEEVLGRSEC